MTQIAFSKKNKKIFRKNIIQLIVLIFCVFFDSAKSASNQPQYDILTHKKFPITKIYPDEKSILIKSDSIIIKYPKKIQFSGNVNIKYNDHILMSDKLIISYNEKDNSLSNLYADGHINYSNHYIILKGDQAWINLTNKNINIYKGTYHLIAPNIHGSAEIIMQRKNNRYTIIKYGNFTSCSINDDYWNITGSEIIYDHIQNNINIWNAKFKIKKIPIFYSPYISLSLNENNILSSCIPSIKYNHKYGLILKAPFPIYLSKYCSGNISSYYTSNRRIKFKTKIHYSIYPGVGLITFNIIQNNKINKKIITKNYYEKSQNLSWKHNSTMHKKWYFHTNYTSKDKSNFIKNINSNYIKAIHNDINQKFICKYNNKNWNASIAYLGCSQSSLKKNNYNNYIVAPQLELNSHYNFYIQKIPFTLKIFNQLTKFIPENYSYPKTIRIHTEPSIYCTIYNNHWNNLNIETKLYFTHYQQKNINCYNTKQYAIQYHLKNTVNRIIPKFKIDGKIILKNKKCILKKYQNFLESKWQYLYVPYFLQENIGMYDSSLIHIDYNNFFNDSIYSGLDRIAPSNQITGNITIRYLNNTHEVFHISIGQILNLSKFHFFNIYKKKDKHLFQNYIRLSGVGHWNFNNHWNTHTEIQYDMQYHNIPFGTVILEYTGKNHHTLQTHYRYINAQYIQNTLLRPNKSMYYKTITQFGMLLYLPIYQNWKINFSHYHNTKTKKPIDQTIGIQYYTPCWNANAVFERKIINFNKICNNNVYDNKIKLDIKISHSNTNFKENSYKILNMSMLPYQHVF